MRLSAHHPRQYIDKGAGLHQDERDMMFALGLQVLVYDNLAYSTKSLEGYLWHVVMYFGFEAFILVLTELITRVEGETVDRAWTQVTQVYENHPGLITESRNALYYAMGNLTLKAWNKRLSAAKDHRPPYQLLEPPSISKLRAQRINKSSSQTATPNALYPDAIKPKVSQPGGHRYHADDARVDLDMSSQMHFPTDTADWDWDCWQSLLDGKGDPFFEGQEQHQIW